MCAIIIVSIILLCFLLADIGSIFNVIYLAIKRIPLLGVFLNTTCYIYDCNCKQYVNRGEESSVCFRSSSEIFISNFVSLNGCEFHYVVEYFLLFVVISMIESTYLLSSAVLFTISQIACISFRDLH